MTAWWNWRIVQWWWFRKYKRTDRRAFARECDTIRWRRVMSPTAELIPCADTPYRCDGFDPADWLGKPPDLSAIRSAVVNGPLTEPLTGGHIR